MAQITIINAENKYITTAKGGYNMIELAYKKDGKVTARKIMDFTNKAVYNAFKDANNGDVFDVTEKKNDKDYWEFATATKSTGEATQSSGFVASTGSTQASSGRVGSAVPKSNYETSEERAARQVMIVRQSSLSNAVALLTLNGDKKTSPEQVISVARQFESYVLGTDVVESAVKAVGSPPKTKDDLNDDINDIQF